MDRLQKHVNIARNIVSKAHLTVPLMLFVLYVLIKAQSELLHGNWNFIHDWYSGSLLEFLIWLTARPTLWWVVVKYYWKEWFFIALQWLPFMVPVFLILKLLVYDVIFKKLYYNDRYQGRAVAVLNPPDIPTKAYLGIKRILYKLHGEEYKLPESKQVRILYYRTWKELLKYFFNPMGMPEIRGSEQMKIEATTMYGMKVYGKKHLIPRKTGSLVFVDTDEDYLVPEEKNVDMNSILTSIQTDSGMAISRQVNNNPSMQAKMVEELGFLTADDHAERQAKALEALLFE